MQRSRPKKALFTCAIFSILGFGELTRSRVANADEIAVNTSSADAGELIYQSKRFGLLLDPPAGYLRATAPPYPGLVAKWDHPDRTAIVLAVGTLTEADAATPKVTVCGGGDLGRFVAGNLAVMGQAGYRTGRTPKLREKICEVHLDPITKGRKDRVIQLYATNLPFGVVITLSIPAGQERHVADLAGLLSGIELTQPEQLPSTTPLRVPVAPSPSAQLGTPATLSDPLDKTSTALPEPKANGRLPQRSAALRKSGEERAQIEPYLKSIDRRLACREVDTGAKYTPPSIWISPCQEP